MGSFFQPFSENPIWGALARLIASWVFLLAPFLFFWREAIIYFNWP